MLKLLIFDMDNTLFDTYGQLGVNVLDEMIKRMKEHGLTEEQEKVIKEKYMTTGFRTVANMLGLSDELKKIGKSTYKDMDLSHIKPFDDVELIKGFGQKKILVTSGTDEVQNQKIDLLGIRDLFDEAIVDNTGDCESRVKIFSNLLKKYKAKPEEAMDVGDNAEAEIAAGNKLGMVTVQILRRPFLKGEATHHVKDLHELKGILEKAGKANR